MSSYRIGSSRALAAGAAAVLLAWGGAFGAESSRASQTPQTIVFICKYGSVKSLVAAETFNKLAKERGLRIRAISRAANPGTLHTEVPDLVVHQLAHEGIDVATYQPKVLTPQEAASATRVVHISLQGEADPNSSVAAAAAHVKEERWNNVPSMLIPSDRNGNPVGEPDLTGVTYQKSRAPLYAHVKALVDELAIKEGEGNVATK